MITYAERLDSLRLDLTAGLWTPSPGELEAAKALSELTAFTTETIRAALVPARKTRSRLVIAMEGVASVLSLPEIHEEAEDRADLIRQAQELAIAVTSCQAD